MFESLAFWWIVAAVIITALSQIHLQSPAMATQCNNNTQEKKRWNRTALVANRWTPIATETSDAPAVMDLASVVAMVPASAN